MDTPSQHIMRCNACGNLRKKKQDFSQTVDWVYIYLPTLLKDHERIKKVCYTRKTQNSVGKQERTSIKGPGLWENSKWSKSDRIRNTDSKPVKPSPETSVGNDTVESGSVQEKVKSRSNTQERNVSGALVRAYLRSCFWNKQVGSAFPLSKVPLGRQQRQHLCPDWSSECGEEDWRLLIPQSRVSPRRKPPVHPTS